MRSIPIVIGREPRELRYTFGSVSWIHQFVPGGFLSIFNRELDLSITHLLLWAGAKDSGVSYEEIGHHLISEGAAYDEKELERVWLMITAALKNDCWISLEPHEDDAGTEGDEDLADVILQLESRAQEYGILPSDFYGLTPREFISIQENFGVKANYRAGVICSTIAQIHSPKRSGQWYPHEFIRCGTATRNQSQSPQEQAAIMSRAFGG